MLCGTCVETGRFELVERPLPETAEPGWALVDMAAVGICGTDYHIFEGKHPYLQYPRVIGHELSGRLVSDTQGMAAGTLVVVNPYISCGKCRACLRGKPNCCMRIEVLGVHRDGGMCSRIAVPVGHLIRAEGLDEIQAAMVEFLAIGAHAVRRSQLTSGDRVLVTGAGPIGVGAALFARLSGADVHFLDLSEARLAMVSGKLGFTKSYTSATDALWGDLGDGYDVVFDATGSGWAIEAGFSLLAHGSTYVLVSVVKDDIRFNDAEFHKRESRIVGSRNALNEDFATVMAAIRDGHVPTAALCSVELELQALPDRLPALAADRDSLIKAVVRL